MKAILFAASILMGLSASAVTVDDGSITYITKNIQAQNVQGVNIVLSQELLVDCNATTVSVEPVSVSGNKGMGLYETIFFDVSIYATEMGCPPNSTKKAVVKSNTVFIKSFTNQHVAGEVNVTIVVPSTFDVQVTAVK